MNHRTDVHKVLRHQWRFGPTWEPHAAMQHLIRSFHTLRGYPHIGPFDPYQFQRWARKTQGSGGLHAARFVLSVWNLGHRWSLGRFDAVRAMSTWDDEMRAAFNAWVQNPWWP